MRQTLLPAAAIALGLSVLAGTNARAAPCRDLHGQFIACPPAKPPPACKTIKSKQPAKCGTAGTETLHPGLRRFNG
jgi:hypothetical protein